MQMVELYIGKDDKGQTVGISNAIKLVKEIPNKIKDTMGIIPEVKIEEENELLIKTIAKYRDTLVEAELIDSIMSGDLEPPLSEETQRIIGLSEKIGCEMVGKINKERIEQLYQC